MLQPPIQHQFSSINRFYPEAYNQFTGRSNRTEECMINSHVASQLSHLTDQTPTTYPNTIEGAAYVSPPRWSSQHLTQRHTSKSPSIRDQTPIRHKRPEMTKNRSSSHSEMMLAYAEEQQRQIQAQHTQQAQQMSPNTIYVPSMDSNLSTYSQSPYNYQLHQPSYMSQTAYYDTAAPPHPARMEAYGNVMLQHSSPTLPTTYQAQRHDTSITQTQNSALGPADMGYGQPEGIPLPSVAAVPSNFPPIPQPLESTPNDMEVPGNRQKPQCWDHGCNGRQFSTFSNLLRHQREKSGTATKARCPHCGTEFTRTTARNGHLYGGKCKGMSDNVRGSTNAHENDEEEGS